MILTFIMIFLQLDFKKNARKMDCIPQIHSQYKSVPISHQYHHFDSKHTGLTGEKRCMMIAIMPLCLEIGHSIGKKAV